MGELKNKTEAELENELKGLIEVRDILDNIGLTWFLSGGALLGAVRNNDFIKWDWDVGIDLFLEELKNLNNFKNKFIANGFDLVKEDKTVTNTKFVFKKYDIEYELLFWLKKGNKRIRKAWKRPGFLTENGFSYVHIRDEKFRAPKNPELILEYTYGKNWRTPIRTNKKNVYLAANFRRGKLAKIIKRIIKTIFYFRRLD